MELLTIVLSGLLFFATPIGLILDRVIGSTLRTRLAGAEELAIRVDNRPSYQALQGKVDRVRFASRGLQLTPELRVALLEFETDPLNIDIQRLRGGGGNVREALRQPLQAGIHLVLNEKDINQALQAPTFQDRLQKIVDRVAVNLPGAANQKYQLSSLNLDFLGNNRLSLQLQVRDLNTSELLKIELRSGLNVEGGNTLTLGEPEIFLNDSALPPFLAEGITSSLGERLNLSALEKSGITAHLLKLEIEEEAIDIAAFVRVAGVN